MVQASKLLLLFLALFLLSTADAVGRRASSSEADGEFTITEGSNRAGNDEEDEELTELGDAYDSKKSSLLDVAPVLKDANAVQKCGGAWATPSTWITDELSTTKTQLCITKDLGNTNYNTALTNGCLTTDDAGSTKLREGVWNDGTDTRTGDDLKCTTANCNTCGQTCMAYYKRGKDETIEWTIGEAGSLQQVGVKLSYIKGSICKQRWFWNATKPATAPATGLGACQHTIKCQTSRVIDTCVQNKCPIGAGNPAICTVGMACKDSTREGSYFAYPFMHM